MEKAKEKYGTEPLSVVVQSLEYSKEGGDGNVDSRITSGSGKRGHVGGGT